MTLREIQAYLCGKSIRTVHDKWDYTYKVLTVNEDRAAPQVMLWVTDIDRREHSFSRDEIEELIKHGVAQDNVVQGWRYEMI